MKPTELFNIELKQALTNRNLKKISVSITPKPVTDYAYIGGSLNMVAIKSRFELIDVYESPLTEEQMKELTKLKENEKSK
jgi:hypothetical protein